MVVSEGATWTWQDALISDSTAGTSRALRQSQQAGWQHEEAVVHKPQIPDMII